jgi:transcriptional regulator with XRE-family HTH domain
MGWCSLLLTSRSAGARAGGRGSPAELGKQLRALREAQHLSQAELARRMGSTQPAIARLEAGRVAPSLDTLDRAAAALGVELVITFQHPQRRGRRLLSG